MKGKITAITELIKGTNSNYVKIFIDEVPFNLFINNMNDKTILANLDLGTEVKYEIAENNGFNYIKEIEILKSFVGTNIKFDEQPSKPVTASNVPNGSVSQYPKFQNPYQQVQEDKSLLIKRLALIKASASFSKSAKATIKNAREMEKLLEEWK